MRIGIKELHAAFEDRGTFRNSFRYQIVFIIVGIGYVFSWPSNVSGHTEHTLLQTASNSGKLAV